MNPKRPKVEPIRQPTLFQMEKLEEAPKPASELKIERPYFLPGILPGTSDFTANGWQGSFYPPGMNSRDFLSYYVTQFATVEVDSTFYGCPSASTVAERVRSGLRNARAKGKRLGRPTKPVDVARINSLRASGHSWSTIAGMMGLRSRKALNKHFVPQ